MAQDLEMGETMLLSGWAKCGHKGGQNREEITLGVVSQKEWVEDIIKMVEGAWMYIDSLDPGKGKEMDFWIPGGNKALLPWFPAGRPEDFWLPELWCSKICVTVFVVIASAAGN